jgi:hypothetical protein
MKNNYVILFLISVLAITACSNEEKIIGKWQLESIEGKRLSKNEASGMLSIEKDGTMSFSTKRESREGTWELIDDNTVLILKSEDGKEDVMRDISVRGDKLSMVAGGNKTVFVRVSSDSKSSDLGKSSGDDIDEFLDDYEKVVVKWEDKKAETETLQQEDLTKLISDFAPFEKRVKELEQSEVQPSDEQNQRLYDLVARGLALSYEAGYKMEEIE